MAQTTTTNSPVINFFNNRSIFITGSTGFMGKVLVEKLLRCTNVRKLYLLIRPKKGVQPVARLEDLLSGRLFESLREKQPNVLNKVVAIIGDITEPGLGISPQDEALLEEEVSVVFHSAATIKFDEELKKSIAMNVEAVQSLIKLCKKMKKLEALVHVSTAYCNCDLSEISEEIYPPPSSPQGMIDLCKWMDETTLNDPQMTGKLIGNRPNTYTFTKALAESVLVEEAGNLPVSIVRPSIVVAAWKEPIPGWVDNLNGPTGLIAGAGKGVLRTIYCCRDMVADIVPVDIPINLMCAVAWRTATSPTNSIPVYNCTTGTINPIRWGEVEAWGWESLLRFPMDNMVWYPGGSFKNNDFLNKLCQIVFHYCPAYLVDTAARCVGKKPIMVRISNKMHKATKALEFFTTNEWRWSNGNMLKLQKEMTPADRDVFYFNVEEIHWPNFLDSYVRGTRQFVFKEDLSTLTASRRQLRRLYWVDKTVQMLMFIMFWRVVMSRSETASRLWNFFAGHDSEDS